MTDINSIPDTLGACADLLLELRTRRLEIQREVDAIKSRETAIKEHIIKSLPESGATGVAGAHAYVSMVPKQVPTVDDWWEVYEYIAATQQFDLLTRKLNTRAVMDRWENDLDIPGVRRYNTTTLSVRKA